MSSDSAERQWHCRVVPFLPCIGNMSLLSQVLATAPHSDQRERPIEETLGAARSGP